MSSHYLCHETSTHSLGQLSGGNPHVTSHLSVCDLTMPHTSDSPVQYPAEQGKKNHDRCFLPCKECYHLSRGWYWTMSVQPWWGTLYKGCWYRGFLDKDIFVLDAIAIQPNVPTVYHMGATTAISSHRQNAHFMLMMFKSHLHGFYNKPIALKLNQPQIINNNS